MRALLAQASFETSSAIAAHYLGRPATPPIALSLEAAWDALGDPVLLAEEIARLSPLERRILEAVCREGGEVETEELLELEREPLRLRTASGATASRRASASRSSGAGLLIPVHPNRHIVPTEVAAILHAPRTPCARRSARRSSRSSAGATTRPDGARFALDPVPLAVALAIAARRAGQRDAPRHRHTQVVRLEAGSPIRARARRCRPRYRTLAGGRSVGLLGRERRRAARLADPPGARAAALPRLATWRRLGRGARRARGLPDRSRRSRHEPFGCRARDGARSVPRARRGALDSLGLPRRLPEERPSDGRRGAATQAMGGARRRRSRRAARGRSAHRHGEPSSARAH